MLNIQRRSGAANNLVLREVDNLKIAQVTLCNINCHSRVLRKVLLRGKTDDCLFLWETGEEETVHFKQQVTKAKVNDDSVKKRKYLEKKPRQATRQHSVPCHFGIFYALEQLVSCPSKWCIIWYAENLKMQRSLRKGDKNHTTQTYQHIVCSFASPAPPPF